MRNTLVIGTLLLVACNALLGIEDVKPRQDAQEALDAAVPDAPAPDSSPAPDAHQADARPSDARPVDAGSPDASGVCTCPVDYIEVCDFNGCRCGCNSPIKCGNQQLPCGS